MKTAIIITAMTLLAGQSYANDSVYSWGSWSQGIKPAAGPAMRITPPPAQKPSVNFRPNEHTNLTRVAAQISPPAPVPVVTPTVEVPVVAQTAPPVSTSLPTNPPALPPGLK